MFFISAWAQLFRLQALEGLSIQTRRVVTFTAFRQYSLVTTQVQGKAVDSSVEVPSLEYRTRISALSFGLQTSRSKPDYLLPPQRSSDLSPGAVRSLSPSVLGASVIEVLGHADRSKMSEEAAIERQLGELEEPEKPYPEDCCGGGCAPCVWDTYYDELEAYEVKREELLRTKARLEKERQGGKGKEQADGESASEQVESNSRRAVVEEC